MIIGINWTGVQDDIPVLETLRKRFHFAKSIRYKGRTLRLQGIATNIQDAMIMMQQADNKHRQILIGSPNQGRFPIYVS